MTALYRLDCPAAIVARALGAAPGDDPWNGGYVAPGKFAPVVTGGREFVAGPRGSSAERRLTPRLWGVPPPPKSHDPGRAVTLVRNPDSPFWIGNLRNSEFRCLIPATSFLQWSDRIDVEGRREQAWFAPSYAPFFAFAGVWKDSEIPSFAIVTCEANEAVRGAGGRRMPVVVPALDDAYRQWLFGD